MSDFCIFCECEPVDNMGWINYDSYEYICPWCIKEKGITVCQCCGEEEATHQLPTETAYFICYSCQLFYKI